MGYVRDAVKGFSWQTVLKAGTTVITLVKIFFLARMLTPTEFGVFSLVMVALGLSEATTQTGVNITMLQSTKEPSYFVDTAWIIAIIRGVLIGVVMVLMGQGFSIYFNQPQLLQLVALAAIVPVIKGLINPSIILLRRDLRFFHESAYHFSLAVVEAVLAIGCALILPSVESLIIALIGAALFEVLISFLFFSLKPKLKYVKEIGNIILSHAKWLSLSSVMGYLNDNIDNLIIGSMTNTHALGLYSNAYALTHKPNYDTARSINHGLLPIFTKITHDHKRLSKAFTKTLITSTLLVTAFSLPLLVFPKLMVQLVLGNQWLEIIPLIPWLVAAGILHSIALVCYTVLLAKATYKSMNIHQFASLVLMIMLMYVFAQQYGLFGAVVGLTISRLLTIPLIAYGTYKALH
jgi:O-antigen/teichoic acid export membrane protein